MSVFRCRTSPCKSQMFRSGGIWSFSEGGCILSLSLWRSIFRGLHICSSAHQTHWAFWTFRTSTAGQKWTQKQSVINAHKRYQIHYIIYLPLPKMTSSSCMSFNRITIPIPTFYWEIEDLFSLDDLFIFLAVLFFHTLPHLSFYSNMFRHFCQYTTKLIQQHSHDHPGGRNRTVSRRSEAPASRSLIWTDAWMTAAV